MKYIEISDTWSMILEVIDSVLAESIASFGSTTFCYQKLTKEE